LGQEAAAIVVLRDPATTVESVRDFVARDLTSVKVPRIILPVTEIPTNAAGKVPRRRLAELYADQLEEAAAVRAPYAPPCTPVENRIASAWSELLKIERVGLNDRFSDLGGDSLLAVSMLSGVNAMFGCNIEVRELWRSPTVASLAELVSAAPARDSSLLFPVRTSGSLPPLFCILPGWFPEVEDLQRYLGPDQPLYALVPDPRPGGPQEGMSPAAIVEECEKAIRSVRSAGPYLLMGRSIGGAVAVHIANRLQEAGDTVAFVGLNDTHYPGIAGHRSLPAPLRLIEQFMGELIMQPRAEWRSWIMRLPSRALRRRARLKRGPTETERAAWAMNTRLERIFTELPDRRFEGRLTMFAAEESAHKGFTDRRIYWSRAATEGLELHCMPGTHNLMTQEPLLGGFAEVLRGCLSRALRR
ncbi:MAG TPA: thioesterase domain-containing protein, partial [Bryobacteraceae bacterium]